MAATVGMTGKGTTLGHSATSGSFVVIAEVSQIEQPEISMDMADFTNYTSPNSTEERLPSGWFKIGDVPVELTYANASDTIIRALVGTSLHYWQITYPDTHTETFQGTLSKLGGGPIPNDARIVRKATISVQTKPVYA